MSLKNRTVQALRYDRQSFHQTQNAVLDYKVDYAAELQGDTVASSDWTDETGGLTVTGETNDTTSATAFVSASSPGNYILTNKIVSAAGRTFETSFHIAILDNETGLSAPDPQTGDYCR